ncbi:GHKL domain-containing protein [Blautia producta]|uniref:GHKL domain-containing protein n=1 Tax=Blautia producta TaxID=33035 RepID=UPI002223EB9F|nr:GHKL domain-containing protein [Blautia producta]
MHFTGKSHGKCCGSLLPSEDRRHFIILKGKTSRKQLRLVADNSFDGVIRQKDGHYYSSKRKGMGLGIQSVQAVVERHGGLVSFEAKDNIFQVSVLIPLDH